MKTAPFQYVGAASVAEAVDALARYGLDAKVLAGGQSLVPLMNLRLARPAVLVDVNRAADLSDAVGERDGALWVGARARHQAVVDSPVVARRLPVLAAGARFIGHLAIRLQGTVGGSLAHADPAAEWPLLAVAFGGVLHTVSPRGERVIPASDFFRGVLTTALESDELVTGATWPIPEHGTGDAVREVSLRPGDFAMVAVAARVRGDGAGGVAEARVALAGVGEGPVRAAALEAAARSCRRPEDFRAAAELVRDAIDPPSDIVASAAYRRHLAVRLAAAALVDAWRAGTDEGGRHDHA